MRLVFALLLVGQVARAEPTTLRIAAIAPDGTLWARDMKAFARGVEEDTRGAVHIKYYFGGIAGDEPTALERARKGQLSGAMGALMCEQLAPSLRVLRVPGLIRTREEGRHIVNLLKPDISAEMRKNGFTYLAAAGFGLDVVFTRKPVTSLAELRATKLWIREHDDVMRTVLGGAGLNLVVLPHGQAARAYDEGRVDGFIAPPASALSFQWSSQAHAFTDFKLGYLVACGAITNAVFDALPVEHREQLFSHAALMTHRFEEANVGFDRQLLGKVLPKQGLTRVEPDDGFRRELLEQVEAQRAAITTELVPRALIERVVIALAEFRQKPKKER
jgi:TRAP-type C4-dicarboxylate transport system substrate-binding protein